jgi:hypothetical protein
MRSEGIVQIFDDDKKIVSMVEIVPVRLRHRVKRNAGLIHKGEKRSPGRPPGSLNKITRTMPRLRSWVASISTSGPST